MSDHSVWPYTNAKDWYKSSLIHSASLVSSITCLAPFDKVNRVEPDKSFATKSFETASISYVQPTDHTMAYALPSYVIGKVPISFIHAAAQLDVKFCVWGIFDAHLVPYAWERGYIATYIPEAYKRKGNPKLFNYERPKLFKLTPKIEKPSKREFYVLAVFPGSDYIYHYARMVHQSLEMMKQGSALTLLEIRRFPDLEQNMMKWMALDTIPIQEDDVVLLGHVEDYLKCLVECDKNNLNSFKPLSKDRYFQFSDAPKTMDSVLIAQNGILCRYAKQTSKDYSSTILDELSAPVTGWTNWGWEVLEPKETGHRVFFLGAKYSYWGNLVREIAKYVYDKTQHLIYSGKCGTLQSKWHIEKIVVPRYYCVVEDNITNPEVSTQIINRSARNFIYNCKPLVDDWKQKYGLSVNGYHISVPTLVGETYVQRHKIGEVVNENIQLRYVFAKASECLAQCNMSQRQIREKFYQIKKLKSSSDMFLALAEFLYSHLSVEEARKVLEARHEVVNDRKNELVLQSMDNETAWFALEAGAKRLQDNKIRYFQAIHRTTDYVRSAKHAASITHDDLASQKVEKREYLLQVISQMIYELLMHHSWDKDELTITKQLKPKLRWGIMGTAQIASKFISSIKGNKNSRSEIVAIASRNVDKAKQFSTALNCWDAKLHNTYERLIYDDNVDAIYIPLPNNLHVPWAFLALSAGKHVLLEKPASLTQFEAKRLLDLSKQTGKHIAEGMPYLYQDRWENLKSKIADCGTIKTVACEYNHPLAKRGQDSIVMDKIKGGGSLYALGCYNVAAVLEICPEIKDLTPEVSPYMSPEQGIDLNMKASFTTNSGAKIEISCSIEETKDKLQQLSIVGDKATITVPDVFFDPNNNDPFQEEIQDFEAVVLDNARSRSPFELCVERTRVMETIAKTAKLYPH